MTTEQLATLKEVAETVGNRLNGISAIEIEKALYLDCLHRKEASPFMGLTQSASEFYATFDPATCTALLDKAERQEDALRELLNMVNYALDARDALLVSKTCATMLKAEGLLEKE